jgi:hypothetical protein
MRAPLTSILLLTCLGVATVATGQSLQTPLDRLPAEVLDIRAPSSRIAGTPGSMRIMDSACRTGVDASVRTRIVNAAVQEWAYFGFSVLDYTASEANDYQADRRRSRMSSEEAARVADTIAGYWAATPNSGWILERQNERWRSGGMTSRWRDPWSAAFISWIMCESGLGDQSQFTRAVAHHTYIDQAIMARDEAGSASVFVAYEPGERKVVPGDMLCRGSRPAYVSIAERRAHLGEGARTHCDIVVKVDAENRRFAVIGGNVRGTVGLKMLPGTLGASGDLVPAPFDGRRIFAHLSLQAEPVPLDAMDASLALLRSSRSMGSE